MLDVACRTFPDTRMKGGWLPAQQSFGICMADRAFGRRHADICFMARTASIAKVGVAGRQLTGTNKLLQCRGRGGEVQHGKSGSRANSDS